jgi:hypothetical protein
MWLYLEKRPLGEVKVQWGHACSALIQKRKRHRDAHLDKKPGENSEKTPSAGQEERLPLSPAKHHLGPGLQAS